MEPQKYSRNLLREKRDAACNATGPYLVSDPPPPPITLPKWCCETCKPLESFDQWRSTQGGISRLGFWMKFDLAKKKKTILTHKPLMRSYGRYLSPQGCYILGTQKKKTINSVCFSRPCWRSAGPFLPLRTRSYYWLLSSTQRHKSCKTLELGWKQKYILRTESMVDTFLPFR